MPHDPTGACDPARMSNELQAQLQFYETRMLTKKEVAAKLGMTVSWLDNSQSDLAQKIRASGLRYGKSRTSPIRFPLVKVMHLLERLGEHHDSPRNVSK